MLAVISVMVMVLRDFMLQKYGLHYVFDDPLTLINIPFRTINPTRPSLAVILEEMKLTVTMRKIVLIVGILASLAVAQVVFAQSTEGVITYEVKTNMHRRLPPE